MAKKSKQQEANVNTTDIGIPETMHISAEPKETVDNDELPPVFKDEARNDIFNKRRKQIEDEMSAQGLETQEQIMEKPVEEKDVPLDAPVENSTEVNSPPSEPEETETSDPATGSIPEEEEYKLPDKVSLKIEGKNVEVPGDTLVTLAQKGLASTQAWESAKREREEAQRLMFAMQQNMQPQAPAAPTNTPQVQEVTLDKDKAREIAKRINYGSEEDQVSALMEYGAAIKAEVQGRSQGLSPEQLINAATQNALATFHAGQEQEILKKEFPDILADYPLSMATDTIANQLAYKYQQEGKQLSRLDLFREAGNLTRERYMKPRQEASNLPAQPSNPVQAAPKVVIESNKIERKRAAPKSPETANKIASEQPPQYGVTASSIVNQMRKSRGQPVYN